MTFFFAFQFLGGGGGGQALVGPPGHAPEWWGGGALNIKYTQTKYDNIFISFFQIL